VRDYLFDDVKVLSPTRNLLLTLALRILMVAATNENNTTSLIVAPLNELDAPTLVSVALATMNFIHVVQHTLSVYNSEVLLEPQITKKLVEQRHIGLVLGKPNKLNSKATNMVELCGGHENVITNEYGIVKITKVSGKKH
jgi:hypothetical protein